MNNKKILVWGILIFLFYTNVYAEDNCSKNGYTIITINGIFTDEKEAIQNRDSLKEKLIKFYNNQPIAVDYIYNPTHLSGAGDLVDVVRQGLFDPKSDYDLVEMLSDASKKVKTQKLLLVGHSQGNFYTNNFYEKVVNKEGGVPSKSIGVYGVATPDNHVSGDGKYITSDTDSVIAATVARFKNIMPPNTHIELKKEDGNGHSFSDVYLKYRSNEIVRDIKDSLDKLESNTTQSVADLCISPQKITALHKVTGALLVTSDFLVNGGVKVTSFAYNTIDNSVRSIASNITKLARGSLALVGFADTQIEEIPITSQESSAPEPILIDNKKVEEKILKEDFIIEEKDIILNEIPNTEEKINEEDLPIIETPTPKDTIISGNSHIERERDNTVAPIIIPPVETVVDIIPPVITLNGNNFIVVKLNGIYTESGATANDNIDGDMPVSISGTVDTSKIGKYIITYTASDISGNISSIKRIINVSTYQYIPTYSFGKNNGDGRDWQVWSFNGSNIYDWTDIYVGNYLHEQFKIQAPKSEAYCTQCLQRGIFNHDPQKGFESTDVSLSLLESNPQNRSDDITYDISIQWDSLGYTYTLSHQDIVDKTEHINVPNINNNFWVGWDGSYNNFKNFPSGNWIGIPTGSPVDRTGGGSMILRPYPIYKESISEDPSLSLPDKGMYIGSGINTTKGRENLTAFNFQVKYTDMNNLAPQKVGLNIINTTTGNVAPIVDMKKSSVGFDLLTDEDFSNGELYVTDDIFYEKGEYEYYFTGISGDGAIIRSPEEGSLNFSVIGSTYKYLPKYSFGTDNGDGNDWQAWAFNGSTIYDWVDTYKNNYLHEQFKIQVPKSEAYCTQCLQRGIFNHDPQKGFELIDLKTSPLEYNPQNKSSDKIYDVSMQWDSLGYSYSILEEGIVYKTGRTDVPGINNNFWVGWDGSYNNFKTFPSGHWLGVLNSSSPKTGGDNMILKPYPIYNPDAVQEVDPIPTPPPVILSSLKEISYFTFEGLDPKVIGVINLNDYTIKLTVPYGTNVLDLSPTIIISDKSTITPNNLLSQDFTNPINYTVKAEDGGVQLYIVSVDIGPNPNPEPPVIEEYTGDPMITSHTFNGNSGDIIINPLINNLSIVFNSNKKVNWMSIKIEKESDSSIYKIFYSSSTCADGTSTCTKVWEDGLLSSGGLLQNGNYKVRVHIKDIDNREYEEYMSSLIIVSI